MTLDTAIARLKLNPQDKSLLNHVWQLNRSLGERTLESLAEELAPFYGERKNGLVALAEFAEQFNWPDLYAYCDSTLSGAYGFKLPRRELFAQLRGGNCAAMRDPLLADVRANLPRLVLTLLLLDGARKNPEREIAAQCEELLPPSVRVCWRTCNGRDRNINIGGYTALWSYVVRYGTAEQVARVGDFAVYISPAVLRSVLQDCLTWEQWRAGAHIIANVPAAHELAASADFWHWATRFMFHTNEPECALACADKAQALGDDTPELQSYRQWSAEN